METTQHAATAHVKFPLWAQMIVGLVLGAVIGFVWPALGIKLQPIGTLFIKAIKMVVMPLVFSAVTLGICKMGSDMKQLGKLGGMAFLWFYTATAISVVLGIALSLIFHPGAGVNLAVTSGPALPTNLASHIDWVKFFLDLVPDNIVSAMAQQQIIPTLVFAICFGLCLGSLKEKAKPVVDILDTVMTAMFKLTHGIISISPLAVAGIMAWVFASQGMKVLLAMAEIIGLMYLGLLIIALFFLVLVKALGEDPIHILKAVSGVLVLAFTTCSSEVTLPVQMEILQREGIPNKIVSFVLPLGYSFNMDGAALYQSLCVCFLAQAYGLHLGVSSILTILLTTLIANKGTANVPAASLVVLAVIMGSLGLPLEAIGILVGVDRFMDMGRTTINVFGNTIAALLLHKVAGRHLDDIEDQGTPHVLTETHI